MDLGLEHQQPLTSRRNRTRPAVPMFTSTLARRSRPMSNQASRSSCWFVRDVGSEEHGNSTRSKQSAKSGPTSSTDQQPGPSTEMRRKSTWRRKAGGDKRLKGRTWATLASRFAHMIKPQGTQAEWLLWSVSGRVVLMGMKHKVAPLGGTGVMDHFMLTWLGYRAQVVGWTILWRCFLVEMNI